MNREVRGPILALAVLVGCGGSNAPAVPPEQKALSDVKAFISANLDDLVDASVQLQAAAPVPDDDGWSAQSDMAAVAEMKSQWKRARADYEHIEGAIAVLFPDLDVSTDERYDGFLGETGADSNLFDDQGVTGIHAIERVLWSNEIPERVVTFEQGLPGYVAADFPRTRQQADDFKNKLCARLVTDVRAMRDQFKPLALDSAAAYRGVIGSMQEQLEKAEKAATGEEESRYAQYTLADMRVNVTAGEKIFEAFKPWLLAKGGQARIDAIAGAFARVDTAYAQLPGDALPSVPETWSSTNPSAADLQTPFGKLWSVLHAEADDQSAGSLVAEMNRSAQVMGIPQLAQ